MKKFDISYLITGFNISASLDGKHYMVSKAQEELRYVALKQAIRDQNEDEVREILIPKVRLVKYANEYFELDEKDVLYMKDRPSEAVNKTIATRLMEFANDKLPIEPIVNFWKKLRSNPSDDSKEQLFGFLEANYHPITPEGNFLAYKKVTSQDGKLVDTHSKSMDNSIGKVVEMKREKVDVDRNNACSHGLHVASWQYAQSFGGNVLVEVLVDPADVVAVPLDYDQQKMRTCKYKVVAAVGYESAKKVPLEKAVNETGMEFKKAEKSCKKIKCKCAKKDKKKSGAAANFTGGSGSVTVAGMTVTFGGATAKQIIEVVKQLTGEEITMSLKNKQPIVKKAVKILTSSGYTING